MREDSAASALNTSRHLLTTRTHALAQLQSRRRARAKTQLAADERSPHKTTRARTRAPSQLAALTSAWPSTERRHVRATIGALFSEDARALRLPLVVAAARRAICARQRDSDDAAHPRADARARARVDVSRMATRVRRPTPSRSRPTAARWATRRRSTSTRTRARAHVLPPPPPCAQTGQQRPRRTFNSASPSHGSGGGSGELVTAATRAAALPRVDGAQRERERMRRKLF